MLIDTLAGIVNTDHIVAVEPAAGEHSIVRLTNGKTLTVSSVAPFEKACGVVVPGQPGFEGHHGLAAPPRRRRRHDIGSSNG